MKIYETSDLGLTASLLSSGFEVIKLIKAEKPRVNFQFKDSKRLKEIIDKYWRKELNVEPQEFFMHVKQLKNRIYNL